MLVDAWSVVSGSGGVADLIEQAQAGAMFDSRRALVADDALVAAAGISSRDSKKLDRFALLGLAAIRALLDSAPLNEAELSRSGIFVGNMLAGWTFTEPQIRALHRDGVSAVSPYLATAWFPASLQGHATILLGMHGIAKTITTDRCSGAQAIGMAFRHLRGGGDGPVFAGGSEAPVTPLVEAAVSHACVVAEGAGFLRLLARERPVPAGAIAIGAHQTFRLPKDSWSERLAAFLDELRPGPAPPLIVCNASPGCECEAALHAGLRRVFSAARLIHPADCAGDTLGASGGIAAAVACELLRRLPEARSALVVSTGHQCADLLSIHLAKEPL